MIDTITTIKYGILVFLSFRLNWIYSQIIFLFAFISLKIILVSSFYFIRYEFHTDDYDIGFGIDYLKDDLTSEPVLPSKRIESHLNVSKGTLVCTNPGTCKFLIEFNSN